MKWPWVVHHSSAAPSSETLPTAAWGSMYPWCTGAVLNSRSTITSAFLKPASMSPSVISTRLATLDGLSGLGSTPAVKRSSCRSGASGRMASTTSITCGSTSYFTSMSFSARLAMTALVAATAATAWPSYNAFSRAMTFRTTSL